MLHFGPFCDGCGSFYTHEQFLDNLTMISVAPPIHRREAKPALGLMAVDNDLGHLPVESAAVITVI